MSAETERANLSEEQVKELKEQLAKNGKPLDTLTPIYHAGGLCEVPALPCMFCNAAIAHQHWRAIISTPDGPNGDLVLLMGVLCPHCHCYTVREDRYEVESDDETPVCHPWLRLFDLVALSHRISRARGETDVDRAKPLLTRLRARLAKPFQWPALVVIGLALWAVNMPGAWAAWNWGVIWSTLSESLPLAYAIWAVYELGVLWASRVPPRDIRNGS